MNVQKEDYMATGMQVACIRHGPSVPSHVRIRRALLYRAYPLNSQWPFLRQIAVCTRLVKNLALEQREKFVRRGSNIRC
jgi:Helix-turn-helix domain